MERALGSLIKKIDGKFPAIFQKRAEGAPHLNSKLFTLKSQFNLGIRNLSDAFLRYLLKSFPPLGFPLSAPAGIPAVVLIPESATKRRSFG